MELHRPFDVTDPAARKQALAAIAPVDAAQHHELLRHLLTVEFEVRRRGEEHLDYYENLYWCGYLLFCVGDPSDVPALWAAKNINMDTGFGFDTQAMFGAGIARTLTYLRKHGHGDLADELALFDPADLEGWPAYQREYFYS